MANGVLRVGVDTGGTFTDFIAWSGKTLWLLKVPSTPDAPERAVLNGLAALLRESPLTPSGSGGIQPHATGIFRFVRGGGGGRHKM
jgi:predicted NBD/HSP70 family sugar kinase